MSAPAAAARDARPDDNDALVALSIACPMEGDIGLCVDRAPDFFVLNRLEGTTWRVGVVDGPDGRPVGCIAVAGRTVHLNGDPTPAMYVSDLKVHPAHRGEGVADTLTAWARDACVEAQGEDALVFLTILAGNRAMQRRMSGPRGLPHLQRVATFRTHTVSLLWRRRLPDAGVTIARATVADVDEMAALWSAVAPRRQFSAVHDADSLAAWIAAAPDLELSSYRLARTASGRLAGFVGTWDQSAFKRLRVTGYSRKLAAVRAGYNALAPLAGGTRLPPLGGALRNLTAVHVCVAGEEALVLRALLVDAYNDHRGSGHSFLNVGLDAADPLAAGLRGLHAQTTDIWFCTASLTYGAAGRELDGRPVHHEIALV
ncbi:MAG: GNAT family N-acetyltransferase [Actinomycetota bacterium]|nr:GNAT family N-acetyltransferase [Actinomycetota bacterium]